MMSSQSDNYSNHQYDQNENRFYASHDNNDVGDANAMMAAQSDIASVASSQQIADASVKEFLNGYGNYMTTFHNKPRNERVREALFPRGGGVVGQTDYDRFPFANNSAAANHINRAQLFALAAPHDPNLEHTFLTSMNQMMEASLKMKSTLTQLIHYKEDAETAQLASSHLIPILTNHKHPRRQADSLRFCEKLCANEASCTGLISNHDFVPTLFRLLESSSDGRTGQIQDVEDSREHRQEALSCLQNMSGITAGAKLIEKHPNSLSTLISLLPVCNENENLANIRILNNLLRNDSGTPPPNESTAASSSPRQYCSVKRQICALNGIETLVGVLRNCHQGGSGRTARAPAAARISSESATLNLLAAVLACLHRLAFQNEEAKMTLLKSGGTNLIMELAGSLNLEKILYLCARLMKVLSANLDNKVAMVKAHALHILSQNLCSPSNRLVLCSIWSLRNLSDQANHAPPPPPLHIMSGSNQLSPAPLSPASPNHNNSGGPTSAGQDALIGRLIQLIAHANQNVSICAIGCLCNLTNDNAANKSALVQQAGLERVFEVMRDRLDQEEVTEPAVSILRHVTHRHELATHALKIARRCQVFPLLLALLGKQQASSLPLIKAVIGALKNFASDAAIRVELINLNIVQIVSSIFIKSYNGSEELTNQRNSIVSMASEISYVDGVRLEDLIELCLATLQSLAKSKTARKSLVAMSSATAAPAGGGGGAQNIIAIAIKLLFHKSLYLQKAAAALLTEMSVNREAAHIIELEGASSRLTELVHSQNEAIAVFAASILYRLAIDKPEEYRNRLTEELRVSLKLPPSAHQEALQDQPHPTQQPSGRDITSPVPKQRGGAALRQRAAAGHAVGESIPMTSPPNAATNRRSSPSPYGSAINESNFYTAGDDQVRIISGSPATESKTSNARKNRGDAAAMNKRSPSNQNRRYGQQQRSFENEAYIDDDRMPSPPSYLPTDRSRNAAPRQMQLETV